MHKPTFNKIIFKNILIYMTEYIQRSLLLCLIIPAALCNLEVVNIESSDDYFASVHKHTHALRGFYDTHKSPDVSPVLIRLFDDLAKTQSLIDNNFHLGLIDLAKVQFFRNHYDIVDQSHFIYFVKNQIQTMPNFNEMVLKVLQEDAYYDVLLMKVLEFVDSRFNRIASELKSIADFEEALEHHKIIGLFYAETQDQLKIHKEFAAGHIDFNYYYTTDPLLAEAVFRMKSKERMPNSPFFAVVRASELVQEFDPEPLVFTTEIYTEKLLEAFFRPERHSKMISEEQGHTLALRLYTSGEKLILYVTDDTNPAELKTFEDTVKYLPKKLIFSRVSLESPKLGPFLQFFMIAGVPMRPKTVYAIHVGRSGSLEIIPMTQVISRESIVQFVHNFYSTNRPLYETEALHELEHHKSLTKAPVNSGMISEEL